MLTREQYRQSKGLPAQGLDLDHSYISPNGRISQRARGQYLSTLRERMAALETADREFDAMVREGKAHDPSLLAHDEKKRQERRATLERQIRYYQTIGMGKRGKVRPTYQRVIDEFQAELDLLAGGASC